MTILIIAATKLEIEPFLTATNLPDFNGNNLASVILKNTSADILITGIGMTCTAYYLTKTLLNKKYELVINAGICGSFNDDLLIGETVEVITEIFGDLGIENPTGFSTLFEMKFIKPNDFPYSDGRLVNSKNIGLHKFKKVNGLTVNSSHGRKESIDFIRKKFDADVESMEGAAVFYICLLENIPFIEIRSISNRVETRNTNNWNIPLAIKNLNQELIEFLNKNIK